MYIARPVTARCPNARNESDKRSPTDRQQGVDAAQAPLNAQKDKQPQADRVRQDRIEDSVCHPAACIEHTPAKLLKLPAQDGEPQGEDCRTRGIVAGDRQEPAAAGGEQSQRRGKQNLEHSRAGSIAPESRVIHGRAEYVERLYHQPLLQGARQVDGDEADTIHAQLGRADLAGEDDRSQEVGQADNRLVNRCQVTLSGALPREQRCKSQHAALTARLAGWKINGFAGD